MSYKSCQRTATKLCRMLHISRKSAFICFCVAMIFFYFLWSGRSASDVEVVVKTRSLEDCISRVSNLLEKAVDQKNVLSYMAGDLSQARSFIPFIGNGYFGLSLTGQRRLFLKHNKALQLQINADLLLDYVFHNFHSLEKVFLDLHGGAVHKVGCFKQTLSMCVSVHHTAMAHRTIPYLLQQQLEISNPTSSSVRVQLTRRLLPAQDGQLRTTLTLNSSAASASQYALTTRIVAAPGSLYYLLSVGEPLLPDSTSVRRGRASKLLLYSFVRHGEAANSPHNAEKKQSFHKESLRLLRLVIVGVKFQSAVDEHRAAWRGLWQRGFSIADSYAPGALGGDAYNRTLYYLMSHRPMEGASRTMQRLNLSAPTAESHRYDRCYGGHDLFQVGRLWRPVLSGADLLRLADQWLLTLEKFGCRHLVDSGAAGLTQAALLAMGEFSFSGNHLEFNMHPSQLVRDMTFRNIAYGPTAAVNVTVEVDDSNKALLFVSALGNKQFYACSAACSEQNPVKLGTARVQLPLRITTPRTPLLYVSPDIRHIGQLRRAIHVHQLRDAPAHEHHVIAMHRHGHPLGGLPTIFWAGLGLLLLVFHLFLVKLVYSEMCKGEPVIQPYADSRADRRSWR